jgi:hypothetical protein
MQHDTWKFSDEDRDRLQPVVDKMLRMANHAVKRACEIADSREGVIEIIQGACEYIAEQIRELILQQVDRGEWAGRGMRTRDEMDITLTVNARAAVEDPEAKMISMSIQPTSRVS